MHRVKGASLNTLINSYNSQDANQPTPAGQALITAGLMTKTQLQQLGGVQQAIALQPDNHPTNDPAFRTFDMNLSYPVKLNMIREGLSIEPGVAFYNLFNMSNYGVKSGTLINTNDSSPDPCGTNSGDVNGSDTYCESNNLRITRNSGTFDQGGPRGMEFRLMLKF